MAVKSNNHHQTEDNGVSPVKGPKFFKIIFDPRSLRLRIPVEFIRRHGENMRNPVFLRVPTGSHMEVELLICGDGEEAWLQKGWPEFRDYYGIGFGQFLVFEYNGNSLFDVLIFDMSACQIDYPDTYDEGILDTHDVKLDENGYDSDDSVVFLEEILASNKGKVEEENLENNLRKRKTKMKGRKRAKQYDDDGSDDVHSSDDCTIRKSSLQGMQNLSYCSKSRGGVRSTKSPTNNINQRRRRVSFDFKTQEKCQQRGNGSRGWSDEQQQVKMVAIRKEKSIAYQRAVAFMSDISSPNPVFAVLLQPSYVSNQYLLYLPFTFPKETLPGPRKVLSLRVSDGRTWAVRCLLNASRPRLVSGWKAFVEDNHLKLGDVCVFEVVKGQLLWNVFIFRGQ